MPNLNDALKEISTEGFQIVSGDMFIQNTLRTVYPAITLWHDYISFNKSAVDALNSCERIRIEVNPKTRGILIVPVNSLDKDGISWLSGTVEKHPRKIACEAFASQLFEAWGWDLNVTHRVTGCVVTADKKVMLLFDCNKPERWKGKEKLKEDNR